MNTTNNKRSKDSVKKIQNTICDLIHVVGFKSINIKMVCEKAKINRTTFYAHFDSIEDALYQICEQYIFKSYKIFLNTKLTYKERISLSLETIKEKVEFLSYLFLNVNNLELKILEIITNNNFELSENLSNEKSKLALAFLISGIVGIFKTYFYDLNNKTTKEISCNDLADLIINTININNSYFLIK